MSWFPREMQVAPPLDPGFLIKHQLVAAAWRPLVEITRRRHLVFRWALALRPEVPAFAGSVVSAGV